MIGWEWAAGIAVLTFIAGMFIGEIGGAAKGRAQGFQRGLELLERMDDPVNKKL